MLKCRGGGKKDLLEWAPRDIGHIKRDGESGNGALGTSKVVKMKEGRVLEHPMGQVVIANLSKREAPKKNMLGRGEQCS